MLFPKVNPIEAANTDILCIFFLRLYTIQPELEEETVLIISPEKDHSEDRKLSESNDCHVSYQSLNSTLKTTNNEYPIEDQSLY
jgi:hypothetical protein